ncbi:MAG: PBP1A family penicillin-binding protein [Deltaproteobacteria bacterium]|nr:PBP1A family penicillin-binding protein [Deltaproteobacteria bacterium]
MRRLLALLALFAVVAAAAGAALAFPSLRRLDALVQEKFNGRRWDFPSRIYSDALLIYPGLDLQAAGVPERLARLGYRGVGGDAPLRKGDMRRTPDGLDLFLHDFAYPGEPLVDRQMHLDLNGDVVTAMRDLGSGEELYALSLEPEVVGGLYDAAWEERREVKLADLPPLLPRAVIVTEDRRFYDHHGIDPVGILRAALTNVRSGGVVQGGSTLTQQLMKNFFLTEARTWDRKGREAMMALLAERRYDKNEILAAYLNEIYLGQNGVQGVFGVWEASQFYFARDPRQLTVGEIALLAGMIRAPNLYSPYKNAERARARRDVVLGLLRDDGAITDAEYETARAEPLRDTPPRGAGNAAPYFVDFLRGELQAAYPPELLTSRGLGIFTSLDLEIQRDAVEAVRDGLAALEKRYPRLAQRPDGQRLQAALVAVRPQTGGVVAMVGGRDYGSSQFNRAVQARRQPGSVFKPFVFLAAFEAASRGGPPLTPLTPLLDQPFDWAYDGGTWRPDNYGNRYLGEVPARTALEQSLNSATARLAERTGLPAILETAQRAGISSPLPAYPAVVLGAAEVTPFEVAQAYATIANQGLRAEARAASKVVDRQGQMVERRPLAVERAASPEAAFLTTMLMKGVLEHGTARAARAQGFTRPAAGKTGTTNDNRDAWFAGFTPDLVAVVWVGFDDGTPIGLTGADAALPIWTAFMRTATAAMPAADFRPPGGVALVRIDPYSGGIATASCTETRIEAFARGTEPTTPCPAHSSAAPAPAAP